MPARILGQETRKPSGLQEMGSTSSVQNSMVTTMGLLIGLLLLTCTTVLGQSPPPPNESPSTLTLQSIYQNYLPIDGKSVWSLFEGIPFSKDSDNNRTPPCKLDAYYNPKVLNATGVVDCLERIAQLAEYKIKTEGATFYVNHFYTEGETTDEQNCAILCLTSASIPRVIVAGSSVGTLILAIVTTFIIT